MKFRAFGMVIGASIGILGLVTPASAGSSAPFPAPTATATVTTVCNITADNPHYSAGAGGVIYKTRITCNTPATLYVNGALASGPLYGPLVTRATSAETRNVAGGVQNTFYTPRTGSVTCWTGVYYQGYTTVTIAGGTTASVSSQRVTAGCP